VTTYYPAWSRITVLLGVGFVVFSRFYRPKLQPSPRNQVEGASSTSNVACVGVALAVAGTVYGLTGEVWTFVATFLVGALKAEFIDGKNAHSRGDEYILPDNSSRHSDPGMSPRGRVTRTSTRHPHIRGKV
jgi:hypothetical protein